MDSNHRRVLRALRVYLVNNLTRLEEILDELESSDILSNDQRERILAPAVAKDRCRHFLDAIVRCGPQAFDAFQQALDATKQTSIVEAMHLELNNLQVDSNAPALHTNASSSSRLPYPSNTKTIVASDPKIQSFQPYVVSSEPRGYILIINVENYHPTAGVTSRFGSTEDVRKLYDLFQKFHYSVAVLQDPTGATLEQAVRQFALKPEHANVHATGLVLLSHGQEHHVIATDGCLVSVDSLISCFTNPNSPGLVGKPKLLIFQACRGTQRDSGTIVMPRQQMAMHLPVGTTVVDSSSNPPSWLSVPYMSDCLIVYSTLPGFVSWRSETEGSLYVSTFVDVFEHHAHRGHVMDLLAEVNNRLVRQSPSMNVHQISQMVNTLRKPFYLDTQSTR